MGLLSKFEGKMEDTVEGAADRMGAAPLSPVQIAKKAEKQMRREKMVGAGKQYAPTLYTVLVNADDDRRLLGYYPTLAGETETYLSAKAAEQGLVMDGQPLVRFIVDDPLRALDVLVDMGAMYAPLVQAGELFRFVTPMFLHMDLMHLGFNMVALFSVGEVLERVLGRGNFLAL